LGDRQQGGVDVDGDRARLGEAGQQPAGDRCGAAGEVEHERCRPGDRLDDVDQSTQPGLTVGHVALLLPVPGSLPLVGPGKFHSHSLTPTQRRKALKWISTLTHRWRSTSSRPNPTSSTATIRWPRSTTCGPGWPAVPGWPTASGTRISRPSPPSAPSCGPCSTQPLPAGRTTWSPG